MNQKSTPLLLKAIERMSQVKSNELNATIASFVMAFILMASYLILKPVRDAMVSDWSDTELSQLWNLQFFISAAIVSLYGYAVTRTPLQLLIPGVYGFFALSFIAFYLLVPIFENPILVEKAFYLWVSAFALFNISVFWSLMADTFDSEQSKRLFPVIAAGISLGALVGPSIPTLFGSSLSQQNFMLIAASSLIVVIPITLYIYRLKETELKNVNVKADMSAAALGGAWWSGFRSIFANPKLLGISVFILLYVFVSSFIYFEQKALLSDFSRAERTQILGGIEWVVNTLTFVMAFFLTGRIVNKFGVGFSLALIPVFLVVGMVVLAFAPLIVILLGIQIVRRAGNYSITKPAKEMLFTRVTKDERFKAKPVVDVVVYRGGDAISGSVYALFTDGLGLGFMAVSLVGAGIASIWTAVAIYLGKRFHKEEVQESKAYSET